MMATRLSIELIPRTAHGMNLRSAASRSQWETIKRLTVLGADGQCEICDAATAVNHPLETHEVWHWDETTHIQSLVRTQALCNWCHHAKHPGIAQKLGFTDAMHRHMMRVNGWTPEELVTQTKDAWREWLRRSLIRWEFEPDLPGLLSHLQVITADK